MKNKLIKYGALIAVFIVMLSTTILPTFAASMNVISETYDYDVLSTLGQTMNGVQTATIDLTGTSASGEHDTLAWTYYMDNLVASTYYAFNKYNGQYFWLEIGGTGDAALQRFSFYTADIDLINPTNIYCNCWYDLGQWQIQFKVDYYDVQGNYLESVSQSYDMTNENSQYTYSLSYPSGEPKYARVCINFYNDNDTTTSAVGRINIQGFGFDYSVPVDEEYYQGYQDGYQAGLDIGESNGYYTGYEDGYNAGYTDGVANGTNGDYQAGYNDGYNKGASDELVKGFFGNMFGGIVEMLDNIRFFEETISDNGTPEDTTDDVVFYISIWSILCTFIVISVILIILKVWRGN